MRHSLGFSGEVSDTYQSDPKSRPSCKYLGEEIMALRPEILISMKRIEIVIDEESLREVIQLFREANVRGYTVIKKAV